jgi:hypothetical protein
MGDDRKVLAKAVAGAFLGKGAHVETKMVLPRWIGSWWVRALSVPRTPSINC